MDNKNEITRSTTKESVALTDQEPITIEEGTRRIMDGEAKIETQAERILNKFGGPRDLVRALRAAGLRRAPSSVYRWLYGKEKNGRGGIVPTSALSDVLRAARLEGIHLSVDDLDPRPKEIKIQKIVAMEDMFGRIRPFLSRKQIRKQEQDARKEIYFAEKRLKEFIRKKTSKLPEEERAALLEILT